MAGAQWTGPRGADMGEWLPVLDLIEPPRQRRLTVLLRLLLLIPHFVVLFFLHIAAFFTAIAGWFAALVMGRLPEPVFRFLAGYLGYHVRVNASMMMLIDRYPPFALTPPSDYPVLIEVRPTALNRLAVFFRLILMIPAAVVQGLASTGWWALSFVWWLITLILGRMPEPLFEATAATLRYHMRFYAYFMMLTPAYPKGFFGDEALSVPEHQTRSATRPLVMSGAGKALLVLFLILGVAADITTSTTTDWSSDSADNW
ncbi:DUF4389 domain-containing protein [Streptomyces sp. NBC_00316]|uniref:DUF4389 domain-containing protein n=1 Tax=Streptomyces sp. NBC_00316 TaxID=2975710 RepID=UPI002E2C5BE1|nr:DUF4389 domain-containing protein [Streptomyces sp. NBC_00316]